MEHLPVSIESINARGPPSVGSIRELHLWTLSEPISAPTRQRRSTAPNCMLTGRLASDAEVLPLTARIHKPSPRAGKSGLVQDVPPPLLVQLPPPPLRTRVSHEGYNFSSSVSLPPLCPHTVVAAVGSPVLPSPDVIRRTGTALPKAVIRVRRDSREQLDVHAIEHNEAAALVTSPRGTAQSRNRFSISRLPIAHLGPLVAAPPPSKAHQHGQRRSQHQNMQGMVSNQAEAPLDATATLAQKAVSELWQVEARWRSLGLPKHLATTELMAELKENPPLPGTSPLGTKGVMAAEVAKQQGDMCGKLHGFLPKATQEAAATDHLAKRSSQWSTRRSTLRSRRRTIAAGGTMMSEQKAAENEDMVQKRDTLAQMPLLAGMSEEKLKSLLPLIDTIDIDTEGHELIKEGAAPTHFFILVSTHCP